MLPFLFSQLYEMQLFLSIGYVLGFWEYCMRGGERMKREEKEYPVNWEVKDPKPPVVRSGHMENRIRNEKGSG